MFVRGEARMTRILRQETKSFLHRLEAPSQIGRILELLEIRTGLRGGTKRERDSGLLVLDHQWRAKLASRGLLQPAQHAVQRQRVLIEPSLSERHRDFRNQEDL